MSYIGIFESVSFPPGGWYGDHPLRGRIGRNQAYRDHALSDRPELQRPIDTAAITCKWEALRNQLLEQWQQLTSQELDEAGPNRNRLARLIHKRYGISPNLAENYLRNFERVLPLM